MFAQFGIKHLFAAVAVGGALLVSGSAVGLTGKDCAEDSTRPCYEEQGNKLKRLHEKQGEQKFASCVAKNGSERGTLTVSTSICANETAQYCVRKDIDQSKTVRKFDGTCAGGPALISTLSLACSRVPEFSQLGLLDPTSPWSIRNPEPIIDKSTDHPWAYDHNLRTIFKSKSGALFAAGWFSVMHRSTDNGVTWNSTQLPGAYEAGWRFVYSMTEDSTGVLYAGGTDLWKSTDGGNTWKTLPIPYLNPTGGSASVNYITAANDSSLIASFGGADLVSGSSEITGGKVARSTDGGVTWNEIFSHSFGRDMITSVVEASDGSLVFRTYSSYREEAAVYRYANGSITRTFSGGTAIVEPWIGLLKAKDGSIYFIETDTSADMNTVDYTQEGTAFLAAYKSTDNGVTWTKLGTLPNSWSIQGSIIEGSDGALYVASHSPGCYRKDALYKSTDKGLSWKIIGIAPKFGNYAGYEYDYVISSLLEVGGKVLIGGNAPAVFTIK